ncbi:MULTISPECIES: stationary phase growth adaptation protein [Enterobacteriaceae]|uniref:Stationary phase growth adaptation protein n=2 Tax=Enterobacteriaceae TaxID=543 RepID=A0AAC8QJS6_9ENTR|nr:MULTISPECIES: stationary phase growth adaptation protein [Enterobacteriaceae]EAN8005732.1 stationary phase growth adaptation protein [Salmonella enterica]EBL3777647.1 stationary phase growth adaptation protein [Salmonella enterica subsp. enterica serovar Agona]MDU6687054.1 stationary phase growth adaptation protein [Enterobacteriaceae bacterium]PWF48055.1 stationary phase growth adaptation protein [[Kluyvera] intestini]RDT49258.1 stationary phase growth adaptation protein [Escherichia coli]
MNISEVTKWKDFAHPDGETRDLSFLDAHEVTYTHTAPGKPDKVYRFLVTYSCHCFCKDYEYQSDEDKAALMYHAVKESRPFCERRYQLARQHLRGIIETLGQRKVIHAGYGSYATVEVQLANGETEHYFVAFKAFREKKKLRLHISSAYPVEITSRGKSVSFFVIAHNLLTGKPLPQPPK